jgi:hypothetical protein
MKWKGSVGEAAFLILLGYKYYELLFEQILVEVDAWLSGKKGLGLESVHVDRSYQIDELFTGGIEPQTLPLSTPLSANVACMLRCEPMHAQVSDSLRHRSIIYHSECSSSSLPTTVHMHEILCTSAKFFALQLNLDTVAAPIVEPLGSLICGRSEPEIAERSHVFPPQMIGPSGTIISAATMRATEKKQEAIPSCLSPESATASPYASSDPRQRPNPLLASSLVLVQQRDASLCLEAALTLGEL